MRSIIAVAATGAVILLGFTGCGRLDRGAADNGIDTSDLGWEAQALQSIGLNTADLVPVANVADQATPSASGPAARRKHRLVRYAFGKSALHGEAVVQTDGGTKTVVVQRGLVTAIDATSMTVKSSDGFTLTWTFGDPLTVLERRTEVQPSAIKVGTEVGVAGAKSGDSPAARLIVVPNKRS